MDRALERVLNEYPVLGLDPFQGAFDALDRLDPAQLRAKGIESPEARLQRLRDEFKNEVIAFHRELWPQRLPGSHQWRVAIPLSLFPRRDRGFHQVEVFVQFETESGQGLRIVAIDPPPRSRSYGVIRLEGKTRLESSANVKLGLPGPLSVEAVAGFEGAITHETSIERKITRECVLSENILGTAARWRFDDPIDRELVWAETHSLAVTIEVAPTAGAVHAAAVAEARSDAQWLTAHLGIILSHIVEAARAFFTGGAPLKSYAEWRDILPSR